MQREEEAKRARQEQAFRGKLQAQLFFAILKADVEQVKFILSKGVCMEAKTDSGATPLMLAAGVGAVTVCETLLEKGASLEAHDHVGATPLILAAFKGQTAAVERMLGSPAAEAAGKAHLLACQTQRGETALMAAAKMGHVATVKVLLKAGAPVDAVAAGEGCATACMMACHGNRTEVVQVLLQHGANPALADACGKTPLMYAASQGATAVLVAKVGKQLLDCRDSNGRSALDVACSSGSVELVTWLMEQGVGELELVADSGVSPLFTAVMGGHVALVDMFLAKGARLEVRDAKGRTPLAWAAAHGKTAMCSFLINKGADLLATDHKAQVPRQLAHQHGHRDTSHFLTEAARSQLCQQ
ncbi:hypothetical protein WJX72_006191 [[Myrmecia] bisecta]|uniref:Ankyrin repeat domain-containing protein 29 n=1 Tax=[Myrmecia] bisecta TaxID=41462 RepID=A0AAW1QRQ8_9CHLO